MARRRRPGARAAARAARSPLLLGACSALVVGVVTIIASCSSSIASASAQATTASASASPPPPFDPTVGWPSSGVRTLDVTLPPAETVEDEEYLCTSVPLPEGIPLGLTRVEPLASAAVVHHILLFGCSDANTEPVWRCRGHSVCSPSATTQHVLYGWAKDAPPAGVPDGAAFRVGHGTGTKSLVMQVHFTTRRPPGDRSGVRLHLGAGGGAAPFSAGLTMFARYFQIPPREPEVKVPNQCCLRGFEPQHAFAFRVHAHDMGRSIYLERSPRNPGAATSVVAKRDPQLPQGFTPIAEELTIWPGDRVTMTCVYDASKSDRIVTAGSTHNDEMCNMYVMSWSELGAFYTCGGGSVAASDPHGPGGLPGPKEKGLPGNVVKEDPVVWPESTGGVRDGPAGAAPTAAAIGQVTSVARAGDGTAWVLRRGPRPWDADAFGGPGARDFSHAGAIPDEDGSLLTRIDQDTGEILQKCSKKLPFWMPHMASPTRDGSVWVTDAGAHTATKLSRDCEVLLTLGERGVPGKGEKNFCKPTRAVELGDGGDVLVSDGYCNARVVRFDSKGLFKGEYDLAAHEAKFPAPGGANRPHVAHDVAVDECLNQILVADREHGAVRRFDLTTREPTGLWDVSAYGFVYAVSLGPYGKPMALTWKREGGAGKQESFALQLSDEPPSSGSGEGNGAFAPFNFFGGGDSNNEAVENAWELPDSQAPHDWALVAGPPRLADAERPLSLLVAESRGDGTGAVKKYVFLRGAGNETLPSPKQRQQQQQQPARELWRRMRESALAMARGAATEVPAADAAAAASGGAHKHHHGVDASSSASSSSSTAVSPTTTTTTTTEKTASSTNADAKVATAEHAAHAAHAAHAVAAARAAAAAAAADAAAAAKEEEEEEEERRRAAADSSYSSSSSSPLLRAKWLGASASAAARSAASAAAGRASSAATAAATAPHGVKGAAALVFVGTVGVAFVGVRAASGALRSARKRRYQSVNGGGSGIVNAASFASSVPPKFAP